MMTEEMKATVFGEVLAELLEKRDMPATLAYVEGLVEGVNTDDAALLIARIEGASTEHPGDDVMAALSDRLNLSRQERREFAFAYTYERRPLKAAEIPEMTEAQKATLRRAIRRESTLNNAYWVIEENPVHNPEVQQEMLDELRSLCESANSNVSLLKRDYGFPGY